MARPAATLDAPAAADATAKPPARLAERALYEQVAEQLRGRILAHTLSPGSWIDEQSLALEFGISRTPLREALKVLASEGLVTMKLRRGAYVTEVSARDLAEVYHLLALLESDAAAVVAQTASEDQIAQLQAIHDELEATVTDREHFFAANERFHRTLIDIAGNHWRAQLVADLRKVMKLNRAGSLLKQGRLDASLKEHRQIMAALKARNAPRAEQLMRAHIRAGRDAASGG